MSKNKKKICIGIGISFFLLVLCYAMSWHYDPSYFTIFFLPGLHLLLIWVILVGFTGLLFLFRGKNKSVISGLVTGIPLVFCAALFFSFIGCSPRKKAQSTPKVLIFKELPLRWIYMFHGYK